MRIVLIHVNHLEASESGNLCTLNFRGGHLRATAIWINCASVVSSYLGVCNNILHSQLTISLLVQLGKTNAARDL